MGDTPSLAVKASIIVLTYNQLHYTRQCLDSILAQTDVPFELIVVDNASQDGTPAYLQEYAGAHPEVRLILNPANEGFARGNNRGVGTAQGEYIVLLNNDTIVTTGWLSTLIRHLQDPRVGMVGPATNSSGNETRVPVDYADVKDMPAFAHAYTRVHAGKAFEIAMLPMQCVVLRRAVWEEIGPLDEAFGVGMFEDDDYAMRLKKAGYKILCVDEVFVHHWGRASFSRLDKTRYWNLFRANRETYEKKWGVRWTPPNFRNPNIVQKARAWITHSRLDMWLTRAGALLAGLVSIGVLIGVFSRITEPAASGSLLWVSLLAGVGLAVFWRPAAARLDAVHPYAFLTALLLLYSAAVVAGRAPVSGFAWTELSAGAGVLVFLYLFTGEFAGWRAGRAAAWLFSLWHVSLAGEFSLPAWRGAVVCILAGWLLHQAVRREGRARLLWLTGTGLALGLSAALQSFGWAGWFAVILFLLLENFSWRYQAKAAAVFTAAFLAAFAAGFGMSLSGQALFAGSAGPPGGSSWVGALIGLLIVVMAGIGLFRLFRQPGPPLFLFVLVFFVLGMASAWIITRQVYLPVPLLSYLLPVSGYGLAWIGSRSSGAQVSEYNNVSSSPERLES